VYTDFQSAGKGQPGNSWESARGNNLLFSIVLHPVQVPVDELFLISELVSIAIKRALDVYTPNIAIKWPNDIYWNDQKLAGILIENSLQGNKIKTVVIGIGLNVNQKKFESDAPNPVSLFQITGKSINRKQLLDLVCRNIMDLYEEFDLERIQSEYSTSLYRKEGFHLFQADELFRAKIIDVHPDGKLELETENGNRKGFYFKEVQFVI
jgi:BirA family biotin operon repressor/biotin-[acetyl-CoA-carboxylase] ligase